METIVIAVAALAGVILGTAAGVLPGFSAAVAIAILLPFTYALDVGTSLCFLGGVFAGGLYGGCLTAIILRIPGAPGNIPTTFDGYPLAKKGMAQEAVIVASLGSCIGGLLGVTAFIILSPILANFALRFGPPELFWLAAFALTTLAGMSSGNFLKGIIAGLFGVLLGTIGLGPATGEPRFVFGQPWLVTGIPVVIALIGFFSIGEALALFAPGEIGRALEFKKKRGVFLPMLKWVLVRPLLYLSSAFIGIVVGLLPGTGGSVAGILAYNETRRWSKKRKEYGTGVFEGVLSPEVANNATEGSSLVPLMSLGIPGSAAAAALMGALLLQGLQPGPELFVTQVGLMKTFMIGLIIAQFCLPVVGILGAKTLVRLLHVPSSLLGAGIICLSAVGAYSLSGTFYGVLILVLCGIIGYFMEIFEFPKAPAVIGLVLSFLVEYNFQIAAQIAGDLRSVLPFLVSRPLSIILMILCALSVISTIFFEYQDKKAGSDKGKTTPLETNSHLSVQKLDIILGGAILLGCAFLFVNTLGLKMVLGRVFPQATLILMMLFSALLMVTSVIKIRKGQHKNIKGRLLPFSISFAVIATLAYTWGMFILGYYLSTTIMMIFLPFVTKDLNKKKIESYSNQQKKLYILLKYLFFSTLFNLIVYLSFEVMLGFRLPKGIFGF